MLNKYKLEYILFLFVGNIFSFFGFSSIKFTSKFLAVIFFKVFRIRRNVVKKNLSIAFPNLSTEEIRNLAFKNYQSIAITFLEILNLQKKDKDYIRKYFSDKGFDSVRKKYKEGKGLILLTAHFGNWEMGAIASGIHMDEGISVLVKKQKNIYVAKWLTSFREKFGNSEITLGASIRELYKTIKNKRIVGIVGDQRGKRDGVKVNLFGKETATFPGTAAIALKTGCPVIVLLCARKADGNYEAIIEEIPLDDIIGSDAEKIKKFNQRYMKILEKGIKKYPEQWFWMHNIWKY